MTSADKLHAVKRVITHVDDDSSSPIGEPPSSPRLMALRAPSIALLASVGFAAAGWVYAQESLTPASADVISITDIFTPEATLAIVFLLSMSGFFSASEVAFFGIHHVRIRALQENASFTGRLVARMLKHPNRLLNSILVGNMIVNVLISVMLPERLIRVFQELLSLAPTAAVPAAALASTIVLVLMGEILPKVTVVRIGELFAKTVAIPLRGIDILLGPVCWASLRFTDFVFRITRFHDIQAAPFITDEEFKSLLARGDTEGVLEAEEGQMIQGILELDDAKLREILVPRPDVIALSADATVGEALEIVRTREYSRMPVYENDLDHIVGILVAKDLLPLVIKDQMDHPVREVVRPAQFVPEIMTIHHFIKTAKRMRSHMAIVVDEYGGTEGIVTLEDAIEEVVGEIHDESEEASVAYEQLSDSSYRVDGNIPLDELSDLIGLTIKDEEHETVGGFLMAQTNKVLEDGDAIEYNGAEFIVEEMEGKRASQLRVEVREDAGEDSA